MVLLFIRRNRTMVLVSVLSFYIGCIITFTLARFACSDHTLSALNKNRFPDTLSMYEYAVLVISGPNNEPKRDAIRATWAKLSNNIFMENGEILYKWNHTWASQRTNKHIIKFYFAIGTAGLNDAKLAKIKAENSRNNDMLLLEGFEDVYKNLALKMLHALMWISNNMRSLKYLVKCDDDSFVRIDLIVRDLEAYAPNMNDPALGDYVSFKKNLPFYRGLYWGYFNGRAKVYLSGKWEETDWFLCDNYLPYALGGGYVVSRSIIDYIGWNADILSRYNSEDVSMGVWTAALDGINRVHDIRFDTEWKSRGCSKHMLVRHKQTPSDMFQLYKTLIHTHGEQLCKTEISERQSYMYKWNVLPSNCCK